MQGSLKDTTNLLVWAQAPHWGKLGGKNDVGGKKNNNNKKKNTIGRAKQAKQ